MPGKLPDVSHEERIASLEEESIRYRALVDSMNDGFGVIDKGGKLTYVNARWASMLGYEPDEMTTSLTRDNYLIFFTSFINHSSYWGSTEYGCNTSTN